MDYDDLLDIGTELGYQLMYSGAEIYRVEESVSRLLTAYGLQPQVFAIPSCLIVSIQTPSGHPITSMRRIPTHGTDIELLESCNDLCRSLCRSVPPLEDAKKQVYRLGAGHLAHPTWVLLIGYIVASAFFAAFFGGNVSDMLCAGLCGSVVGFWTLYLSRYLGVNGFFQTLIGASAASLCALFLTGLGIGQNQNYITIGTLMVLVPGMALTTAMREVVAGDIISGITRTAEAILTAVAISLGVMLSLALGM